MQSESATWGAFGGDWILLLRWVQTQEERWFGAGGGGFGVVTLETVVWTALLAALFLVLWWVGWPEERR